MVGRDDAAIREGIRSVLAGTGSDDAFLRRVQLDEMPIQTAMLLLRQSLTPSLNYHLRCIAPVCIEDEARLFDQRMMEAAADKLGLNEDERRERTFTLLQRRLRDGGWGSPLLSARHQPPSSARWQHAAQNLCLPSTAATRPCRMVHSCTAGWTTACSVYGRLHRVTSTRPTSSRCCRRLPAPSSPIAPLLIRPPPPTPKFTERQVPPHLVVAAVQRMKEQTRQGDKWEWAHYKSVTAKGAWDWKVVVPDGPQLCLSHAEYTLAARLSLGLQPFPAHTRAQLPEHCPLCMHRMTGKPVL